MNNCNFFNFIIMLGAVIIITRTWRQKKSNYVTAPRRFFQNRLLLPSNSSRVKTLNLPKAFAVKFYIGKFYGIPWSHLHLVLLPV
jgi:hypothetical protein